MVFLLDVDMLPCDGLAAKLSAAAAGCICGPNISGGSASGSAQEQNTTPPECCCACCGRPKRGLAAQAKGGAVFVIPALEARPEGPESEPQNGNEAAGFATASAAAAAVAAEAVEAARLSGAAAAAEGVLSGRLLPFHARRALLPQLPLRRNHHHSCHNCPLPPALLPLHCSPRHRIEWRSEPEQRRCALPYLNQALRPGPCAHRRSPLGPRDRPGRRSHRRRRHLHRRRHQ